ncbi:unnamed protein product [Cuscuta campestris]|uniref:Transcription repressor n=1 Tax=Cuscuta campestris TaxID=132261 RepID=A0A484LWF4_9ASTE|nr:unnamed protein product [Cuscuta campestris]
MAFETASDMFDEYLKMSDRSISQQKSRRELLLQWRRPACVQATKTLSFRGPAEFGPSSGESRCFTASSEEEEEGGDRSSSSEETIIREVVMRSSDRLFFEEPGECATSSLFVQPCVEEAKEKMSEGQKGEEEEERSPFKEGVVVAMETKDPYRDFKRSMQEMVECYIIDGDDEEGKKLKKWEWLQELLGWYLKMNVDGNHGWSHGD